MFETSVIQSVPRASGGRLSLLTISIIAHTTVIVGAIVLSVATVDFPASAPDEFAQAPIFLPVIVPPPLGVLNGGAVRQPEPARPPAAPPQPQPNQITAPSMVPDTVTPVAAPSTGSSTSTGDPSATSTLPLGVPWGVKDSVGDLDAPPGVMPAQPVEEKIYEEHEVKAPVALFKPHPPYPQSLIRTRMRATVVVRCVIDKNGHVRDPQVIVPATMSPFNDSVMTTVQRWRFTPGSLRGQAVETYLNLTVNFATN
ncbi:MAG: energy transducer TonB [Acidobacteriota bacterium]|nr:energy transducer TonB [Acidobacteriota bacterium]